MIYLKEPWSGSLINFSVAHLLPSACRNCPTPCVPGQYPAIHTAGQSTSASEVSGHALVVAVVDHYRFSQECLVRALKSVNPADTIVAFATGRECIAAVQRGLDLLIYYSHGSDASQHPTWAELAAIHHAYPSVPLLVLSDIDDLQHPGTSRSILESGADDFIPTRSEGLFTKIGALRFAKQGGELTRPDGYSRAEPHPRLTPREFTVLTHLQRGKANKIIAHELSMSENTVKIHVRNIMRKMGSTNRTQAVDKARTLWGAVEQPVTNSSTLPVWCRRKTGSDRRVGVWRGPSMNGER